MIRRLHASLCLVSICVIVLGAMPSSAQDGPLQPPVQRETTHRDHDLIQALIDAQRFDDALQVVALYARGAEGSSDPAARAAIWRSQIETARQMSQETFDSEAVQRAEQPIVELLNAYPDHPRRWFLQGQRIEVLRHAALHRLLRAVVNPNSDELVEQATRQLVAVTSESRALAERVADERSRLGASVEGRASALSADLQRLQQQLKVTVVAAALMQTELFPPESRDRVGAATRAEQAADTALQQVPADSQAYAEVQRLRVEAILQADQPQRAYQEYQQWLQASDGSPTAARKALAVRLDLARGRSSDAQRRLTQYYGKQPAQAPLSIEMDLARLQMLLQQGDSDAISAWLDAIEQRGGAYARRRGEAMALQSMRQRGSDPQRPAIDAAMVAAQGRDWLRRGDHARGGELLAAAARAEQDPARAIRHATQAAAALNAAQQTTQAAKVMREVASKHAKAEGADALHLQAVVLLASKGASAETVEPLLRSHLKQWPDAGQSSAARQWLVQVLSRQERLVEAAEVASQVSPDALTQQKAQTLLESWRDAFRAAPSESLTELAERARQAWQPLRKSREGESAYRLLAALWFPRAELTSLLDSSQSHGADFTEALLRFRREATVGPELQNLPVKYQPDATERLLRDGRQDATRREQIAELLEQWHGEGTESIQAVEILLWQGKIDRAIAVANKWLDASASNASKMAQLASLFGQSSDARSREQSLKWWDQLSSGTRKGSEAWHEAKLAAIRLLQRMGRADEGRRRAKYILLTQPDMGETHKQQYQRLAGEPALSGDRP